MGDLKNMIKRVSTLDAAIESALDVEVRDVVKRAVAESAVENVYNAYDPEFRHRRGELGQGGGITDPESVVVTVIGNELTASDDADWQQLWGGAKPSERLAQAIADGDERYHMGGAGPRPFHEKAKERLIMSGELEAALREGLRRQGIDASGITFRFI